MVHGFEPHVDYLNSILGLLFLNQLLLQVRLLPQALHKVVVVPCASLILNGIQSSHSCVHQVLLLSVVQHSLLLVEVLYGLRVVVLT